MFIICYAKVSILIETYKQRAILILFLTFILILVLYRFITLHFLVEILSFDKMQIKFVFPLAYSYLCMRNLQIVKLYTFLYGYYRKNYCRIARAQWCEPA